MRSSEPTAPAPDGGGRINSDVVAGGVGFLVALAFLGVALSIPEGSFGNAVVGPKALPVVIGLSLALASLALAVRAWFRTPVAAPAAETQLDDELEVLVEDEGRQDSVRLAVVSGLLLAYILLFVPLGYVTATFLFLLATTMYLDREHPVRNLLFALLFPIVVRLVFTELLSVVLPAGPLGL